MKLDLGLRRLFTPRQATDAAPADSTRTSEQGDRFFSLKTAKEFALWATGVGSGAALGYAAGSQVFIPLVVGCAAVAIPLSIPGAFLGALVGLGGAAVAAYVLDKQAAKAA